MSGSQFSVICGGETWTVALICTEYTHVASPLALKPQVKNMPQRQHTPLPETANCISFLINCPGLAHKSSHSFRLQNPFRK